MAVRTVLHADMNNCYASIEMLHHPKLRGQPKRSAAAWNSGMGLSLPETMKPGHME